MLDARHAVVLVAAGDDTPPEVLAYVVVHELCHLRHMNHSARFWELLDEAWPTRREQQAWLRRHGAELHSYVPPTGV